MKLGIFAQRPIFITPYKSLRHKDFRNFSKNASSHISMYLPAKKGVWKK